jgi:hypothetical protein
MALRPSLARWRIPRSGVNTYARAMTDSDLDFGAGFVAASPLSARFARDAAVSDDRLAEQSTARDELDHELDQEMADARERAEEAAEAAEASGDGFLDDFAAFTGHDGGGADFGDLDPHFGRGATDAGPALGADPLIEIGPDGLADSMAEDDLGFELSQHLADAQRSSQMQDHVSRLINESNRAGDGGGGGGTPAGDGADPNAWHQDVVTARDDDDLDLFQA